MKLKKDDKARWKRYVKLVEQTKKCNKLKIKEEHSSYNDKVGKVAARRIDEGR